MESPCQPMAGEYTGTSHHAPGCCEGGTHRKQAHATHRASRNEPGEDSPRAVRGLPSTGISMMQSIAGWCPPVHQHAPMQGQAAAAQRRRSLH